jgi:hypothetical protein
LASERFEHAIAIDNVLIDHYGKTIEGVGYLLKRFVVATTENMLWQVRNFLRLTK